MHASSQLESGHGRDMPSLLHVTDDLLEQQHHLCGASSFGTAVSGNLSPITDSPPSKQQVSSTYANDLNYSDDDNDFLLCDDDINNHAHDIEYMDTKEKTLRYRRGNLILGGPQQ
jgi:hypothetical protein